MVKNIFFIFVLLVSFKHSLLGNDLEFISFEQLKKIEAVYGIEGKNRLIQFNNVLVDIQNKSIMIQLKVINDFFNSLTYKEDSIHWKQKDYWAPPFEFLGSGAGDCEDYAIAKYFALRLLGIDSSKLKITFAFVKNHQHKVLSHAVLNYYHNPKATPIVLDNINKQLNLVTKRKDILIYRNIDIAKVIELQNLLWS